MAAMTVLVWFRNDLRVEDNPALSAALAADEPVVALFVATPGQWRRHGMAPIQAAFIHRNLQVLAERLDTLAVPLLVRACEDFAAVGELLAALAREHHCGSVYCNAEYAINEKRRDAAVRDFLAGDGVSLRVYTDRCVLAPGSVRTRAGGAYSVFTPFARRWRELCSPADAAPLPTPSGQKRSPCRADVIDPALFDLGDHPPIAWPAGEKAAKQALARFAAERIEAYRECRDLPAVDATSRLSPYLALGVLSPRLCLAKAAAARVEASGAGREGIDCWVNELIWREFYIHVMDAYPRICMHRAFRPETEAVAWRDSDADFEAWSEGRTGIPLVDAAMRQLTRTGWMHNRLRMVVAMFLSKNLLLDWRRGEAFFMRHLIDGDLAANNGGWQWAASTGTDAVPYFRIFNPVTQSRRFDPDSAFIRRYVPELAPLDARRIHDPDHAERARCGYPPPIVDLKASRARAIAAFAAVRATPLAQAPDGPRPL